MLSNSNKMDKKKMMRGSIHPRLKLDCESTHRREFDQSDSKTHLLISR
jgi:hypothetical protein